MRDFQEKSGIFGYKMRDFWTEVLFYGEKMLDILVKWGIFELNMRDSQAKDGIFVEKTRVFCFKGGFRRVNMIFGLMGICEEETRDFPLNGEFSKRKRVIFT